MPQQFENPANIDGPRAAPPRRKSSPTSPTSPPDVLITGVGTGGHLHRLRRRCSRRPGPNLKAFAVEPTLSPVISGGQPGPHPIQGIGAGFIPTNLHTQAIDGAIQVEPEDAKEMARRCGARGRPAGRHFLAARRSPRSRRSSPSSLAGARVIGFNYDTGERYLSVPDFLPTE